MSTPIDSALLPPKQFHIMSHTDANFINLGHAHLNYFRNRLKLRNDAKVLEIGSGNGRIARALSTYLNQGSYIGVDIMKEFIDWCTVAYQAYPNFHFEHIDVFNKHYNPNATTQAKDYRFPFPDEAFDFVYLTSVFTHMLQPDLENYIREISRMLKPGGCSFITYFLINEETSELMRAKKSRRNFLPLNEVTYVINPKIPEMATAYAENYIRTTYADALLAIDDGYPEYGKWRDPNDSKSAQNVHNQDRIVAHKARFNET